MRTVSSPSWLSGTGVPRGSIGTAATASAAPAMPKRSGRPPPGARTAMICWPEASAR